MKYYVVIDTNVIVSALLSVENKEKTFMSSPFQMMSIVLDKENKIIPVFNDEIIKEYTEVLSRPRFKISKSRIGKVINDLKSVGLFVNRAKSDEYFPDPKDIVFYEVTMESKKRNESFLVTGNLKHFPKKPFVVTPSEMIEIIRSKK